VPDDLVEELLAIAERLKAQAAVVQQAEVSGPLAQVANAAAVIGKAWSGSNLGYHSRVYYGGFQVPPPGAHFDSEMGFRGQFRGTTGDWEECRSDDVIALIYERGGAESLDEAVELGQRAHNSWTDVRSEAISILSACLARASDPLVESLRDEAENVKDLTEGVAARALVGPITVETRDSTALSQGFQTAPHQLVEARVIAIRSSFDACATLAGITERAASHIARMEVSQRSRGQDSRPTGENVFIGHGQSLLWRELKDFVDDRLGLPWDEFNRVPVAGVTNIARLSEMLDYAGVALLVLTAEDELTDGNEQARQNVVHEAGLFQGRLGFSRAIVLLEEGCEEFSNIQGLGQVRFPTGQISGAFEEVRRVLEREGFVNG